VRTRGLHALALICSSLAACGARDAPEITIRESCRAEDLEVQVEGGHPLSCAELLRVTQTYRAEYEARFGRRGLGGRPVRYRDADFLDGDGHTGRTYPDAIDLARFDWAELPHELNHVRTGPGHDRWCLDFEPWSEAVLGVDERAYLGCP